MKMYLLIAARNLVQARRRTLLIGSALGMVTMLLVLLLALSQALTDTMIASATTLQTGHVNVAGWFKAKPADSAPLIGKTAELRKIVEENTPGLDYVIDRGRGWARMVTDTGATQVALSGIDPKEEQVFFSRIQIADGDPQKLSEPGSILIFESQAKALNAKIGDTVTLTVEMYNGNRNTADATIIAIAKDVGFMSSWNSYIPKDTIRLLYGLSEDTSGAVMVYLKDVEKSAETMKILRDVFEKKGFTLNEHDPQPFFMKFETIAGEDWVGQRLDITTWNDEVSYLNWITMALDSISIFLTAILGGIIAVGIMNSMWISVRERTQEIGTLRAIGMGKSRILGMFMMEATLLGLAATGIGALAGVLIAVLVDAADLVVPVAMRVILMSDTLNFSIRPGQIVTAMILFTICTILAAMWPAWRASRLQPVTAIQSVT